jgi:hypothetical protein
MLGQVDDRTGDADADFVTIRQLGLEHLGDWREDQLRVLLADQSALFRVIDNDAPRFLGVGRIWGKAPEPDGLHDHPPPDWSREVKTPTHCLRRTEKSIDLRQIELRH